MQALILATWSSEDSRVLPGPRPSPWSMLALVCADSGGSAHCSPTFLLPSNRWQCFPAVSHHVGGWGASCLAGFGSLRLMRVQSVVMWVWVCTYVYITEVSVRNALW